MNKRKLSWIWILIYIKRAWLRITRQDHLHYAGECTRIMRGKKCEIWTDRTPWVWNKKAREYDRPEKR